NKLKINHEQIKKWEKFCNGIGEEPANVALAWLLHQPGVTAPIIGPRTAQQLETSIQSVQIKLDKNSLDTLDSIFPPAGEAPQYYAW
ncbi:MAG: aldo/keto reductase, partial [Bacteroidota bacterium]